MKKILTRLIISSIVAVGLFGAPVLATENEQPTFTTEFDQARQASGLWAGKNFLLAGNELTNYTDVKNGLLFAAGNSLQLEGSSEYGFIAGNIVNFAGTTARDLYVAGNIVNLTPNAQIGRDVFVASNELYINTNLTGALSVTAAKVIIADDVKIDGNANLDAGEIILGNNTAVGGTLTYNDSATVTGIENVKAGQTKVYRVETISPGARLAAALSAKFLSIISLFLAMILTLFICPKLRGKVHELKTTDQIFPNAACGLGALAVIPIVSIFALFTIVGAPIGLIALLLYAMGVYLAQGITGMWLGHAIFSRLKKTKTNPYLEILVGVTILGLLALIPLVGIATGFISLVFGFGTLISCLRSARGSKSKSKSKPQDPKLAKTPKIEPSTKPKKAPQK